MSSQTFDPNKISVEDVFRGKEERRRRLAKLPFEEKIEILKRLQSVPAKMAKNERLIFESFLRVCSDFADGPIKEWDIIDEWYAKREIEPPTSPFDQRPDVIAVTASGKRIGVELKGWVNREQIAEARKQERIQDNILQAIGEQPRNATEHIGYVWLSAKEVRFDSADAAEFREQIFALVEQVDNNWSEAVGLRECSHDVTTFTRFPILERYLQSVRCAPRPRFETHWIHFPSPGGAYSPNEMLETLSSSLAAHKTDARYKDLRDRVGLDEVYLLVHYDFKAFAYNTPFDAPNFGFKQAAEFASKVLNGDGGYFDRIFLSHFLWGKEEACRVF